VKLLFSILAFLATILILPAFGDATVNEDDFVVEKYVTGICCSPTTIGFVGKDILVLEKATGHIQLIRNGILQQGVLQQTPVLEENVTSIGEQGMLSIATDGNKVYLYFTESSKNNGPPLGKRIYSYDWNGEKLVNKTLVKDLPQTQIYHNGGGMTFDKNGYLYIIVGDAGHYGKLQNHVTGEPDDTGVILQLVPPGPYYAIGIRNSFGLTMDPVTGKIWDTENGPDFGDEINMVPPKFNSGWDVIMGPANNTQIQNLPKFEDYVYHDPQFTWWKPVAPTGLAFADSDNYGKYKNDLFVGDCNNGNLYRFTLNQNRDGFVFQSPQLQDKVVNQGDSMNEITFGTGFGCITDVKMGPDGWLYVVSLSDGTIYRIASKEFALAHYMPYVIIPGLIAVGISFIVYFRFKKKLVH
jgi:glucose/arabinose dehydrogenase